MGCPGCEQEANMVNIQQNQTLAKAIDYAKEKQKVVAIYKEPNGFWQFAELQYAQSLNLPLIRFISPNIGVTS